jgi:hypothetical protein
MTTLSTMANHPPNWLQQGTKQLGALWVPTQNMAKSGYQTNAVFSGIAATTFGAVALREALQAHPASGVTLAILAALGETVSTLNATKGWPKWFNQLA